MEIARISRKHYPKAKIILGGIHPTIMPEEGLRNGAVDIVVRGEAERVIANLISNRSLSSVRGISYMEGSSIIHNQSEDLIEDLDTLPMPAYDLLSMPKYYSALGSYKRLPSIGLIVSRGCPGRCTFCLGGKIFGSKIRYFSPRRIFDEISYLSKEYGFRDICFYDDNFTTSKNIVSELCDLMISNRLDISWSCFSRIDTVNFDLLQKMKRSGCHQNPGTAFYKWADENDYLLTYNWDDYDLSKPIVNLPTITTEQIKKYYF